MNIVDATAIRSVFELGDCPENKSEFVCCPLPDLWSFSTFDEAVLYRVVHATQLLYLSVGDIRILWRRTFVGRMSCHTAFVPPGTGVQ